MKKIVSAVLAGTMAMSLAACGGSAASSAASVSEASSQADSTASEAAAAEVSTVTEGVLTVATSPDFAPYEFYAISEDGTPELAGFEMELAQYIADYMGLELEVIAMDFDGTLMELQNKTVDLGMAGYSPKPEREALMDFSDIFYTGGQSFVTTQANKDKFTSLEDTNKAEYSLGAQTGSIQVDLCQENSPEAQLVQLPKVTDIVSDLLAGNLDGAYIETAVAESYAKTYPDLAVVLEVPYDQAGSVVGVYKGNTALLEQVNAAIAQALSDGSMDEFVAHANEQASGDTYEGVLDADGNVQAG